MAVGRNSAFFASVIGIGSMAPFCTMLPMPSCASMTRSGPVPAWDAVMNCDCTDWAPAMVWTLTGIPLSAVNCLETSVRMGAYCADAQIVRAPSVLAAGAADAPADGGGTGRALPHRRHSRPAAAELLVVVVELPPQAARASAAIPANAASRVFLRCMCADSSTLS